MQKIGGWCVDHLAPTDEVGINIKRTGSGASFQVPRALWRALEDAARGLPRDPAWYPRKGDILVEPGGLQIAVVEIHQIRDELIIRKIDGDGAEGRAEHKTREEWRDLIDVGNYRLIAEGDEVSL